MRHRRFTHFFRRTASARRALAAAMACGLPRLLHAQAIPSAALPALPAYTAPRIALARPESGGSIYQDRPTILFRFASGDSSDILDLGSFAVTVDGVERTRVFQLSATEAWGPIATPDSALAVGDHLVSARICSMRSACAAVRATVIVLPPFAAPARTEALVPKSGSRFKRALGVALDAARRVLAQ